MSRRAENRMEWRDRVLGGGGLAKRQCGSGIIRMLIMSS